MKFWKKLAVKRRLKNKDLAKRNKDLEKSRDQWKNKARSSRVAIEKLESEVKRLDTELKKN